MRKALFLFIGLLLLTLVTGCGSSGSVPIGDGTYRISGTVTTPVGGPVEGVTIECGGTSAVTQSDGNWSFDNLSGTQTITAARTGWCFEPTAVQVSGARDDIRITGDKLILFISDLNGDGYPSVNSMATDGSNIQQLAYFNKMTYWPRLSPDGKKIAFSAHNSENPEIYVVNLEEGTGPIAITGPDYDDNITPNWSPDSSQVVHAERYYDGQLYYNLWITDAASMNSTRLTNLHSSDIGPSWSEHGIIFSRAASSENRKIYFIGSDGNDETVLASDLNNHLTYPVWSPDGSKLLYIVLSTDGTNSDIYVADYDPVGPSLTNLTCVTDGITDKCTAATWNADGSKIIFEQHTALTGHYDICIMNTGGSGYENLTNNVSSDSRIGKPTY